MTAKEAVESQGPTRCESPDWPLLARTRWHKTVCERWDQTVGNEIKPLSWALRVG